RRMCSRCGGWSSSITTSARSTPTSAPPVTSPTQQAVLISRVALTAVIGRGRWSLNAHREHSNCQSAHTDRLLPPALLRDVHSHVLTGGKLIGKGRVHRCNAGGC